MKANCLSHVSTSSDSVRSYLQVTGQEETDVAASVYDRLEFVNLLTKE